MKILLINLSASDLLKYDKKQSKRKNTSYGPKVDFLTSEASKIKKYDAATDGEFSKMLGRSILNTHASTI